MEKTVVTIKTLQYEKMYKEFYSDYRNIQLSKHVFFQSDRVNKIKVV